MEQLKMTLVKTKDYELKPFGKFTIKSNFKDYPTKPNYIEFNSLSFDSREGMTYTPEQYETIVKYMKKHKTDILVDSYKNYYTIVGDVLVKVLHKKLYSYQSFLSQRDLNDYEDENELWNEFIGK